MRREYSRHTSNQPRYWEADSRKRGDWSHCQRMIDQRRSRRLVSAWLRNTDTFIRNGCALFVFALPGVLRALFLTDLDPSVMAFCATGVARLFFCADVFRLSF